MFMSKTSLQLWCNTYLIIIKEQVYGFKSKFFFDILTGKDGKIILLRYYLLCVHSILILLLKILLINPQVSWEVDSIIPVTQMREMIFRDSREQSKG